jgi:hypothetical protein
MEYAINLELSRLGDLPEEDMHPRDMYSKMILTALEGSWDDIPDLDNILNALEGCARTIDKTKQQCIEENTKSSIAPAYKIMFRENAHAVLAERLFEEEYDKILDIRLGNTLYFSKEWWDKNGIDIEDFRHDVEDIACVAELDYTPEIEIVAFDFSEHD